MIEYRPFSNSDPREIASVWNSQPPLRRRIAPITCAMLEQHLFAKPYFDPAGLIVAVENGHVVGFVHAGFPPGTRQGELDRLRGVIGQLQIDRRSASEGIAAELLRRAEAYLHERGARESLGGAVGWRGPFCLGLYGGSQLPGVLQGDAVMAGAFQESAYIPIQRRLIFERNLADFRPTVDRQLMQFRRQYKLEHVPDRDNVGWDEACAWCWLDRDEFELVPVAGGQAAASLTFWNMEPLSGLWGIRAAGLLEARVVDGQSDVLPCFLGEALRHFQSAGVTLCEVHVSGDDMRLNECCRRLGFSEVDYGIQYRRTIESP